MKKEIHIRWQLFFYDASIFILVNALLAFPGEHLTLLGIVVQVAIAFFCILRQGWQEKYIVKSGDMGASSATFTHGNQFSRIPKILNRKAGSRRASNMIWDNARFGAWVCLYFLMRLRESLRRIFMFCCTFLSRTRKKSSRKCTSKSQCIVSTAHSIRAWYISSLAVSSRLLI